MTRLYAPWTREQVEALRKRQSDSSMHPYTCYHGHTYTPTADGWVCRDCQWIQKWCHGYDACDDEIKSLLAAMDEATFSSRGFERALYLLLKAFASELPPLGDGTSFHKAFRQTDVTDSAEVDMAIWNALQGSDVFWECLEKIRSAGQGEQ